MRFTSTVWDIDLAKGWTAEPGEIVTIWSSRASGALEISSFRKPDGPITQDELGKFAKCDPKAPREKWGEFEGYHSAETDAETILRKWVLVNVRTLLFITHKGDLAPKIDEKADVDQMVNSLRVR
jgi:hypothetical protein